MRPVALVLLVVALLPAGRASGQSGSPDCPVCVEATRVNGWCDACGLGWVGDVPIRSRYLWEVLDAHGHDLNFAGLGECCAAAADGDGFCEDHRLGFVGRKAYFSRLTWLLARSEREPSDDGCPACRDGAGDTHWCAACGVGRVGRFVLRDRAAVESLVHELQILAVANQAAARCAHCAAAIVTDTECPFCRVRYRDGRPLQPRPETGVQ